MRLLTLLSFTGVLLAQSPEPAPKFEIADVHVSAKTNNNPFPRTGPVHNGRYEIKTATMLDLIRIAWSFDPDKILGGPNWLEMDRFDIVAKLPPDSAPDATKQMLQSLLSDRFKLVLHNDTRPLPVYVLVAGKKPLMKQADGTGDAGCKLLENAPSAAPPPGEVPQGVTTLMTMVNGKAQSIRLGPGGTLQYQCRNMTMASFVENLRSMMGVGGTFGSNPVREETGLEGRWNFDLRYSMQFMAGPLSGGPDRISIFDAVEKQLGLKLEQRQVPTPVMIVDSVNRRPTENPPGVAEALPPIAAPQEFEVADIKPTDPETRMGMFQTQPGGRLNVRGMGLSFLVQRAFNANNNEEVTGLPPAAIGERFDITAKASTDGPGVTLDNETMAPMLRALLVERFKMTYHKDEKTVTTYVLAAGKPKMKKADPNSRTWCKNMPAPPNAPPGSQVLQCQNIAMAEFADRLQNMTPELSWPVADATGIEGGWDFTLTYSRRFPGMAMAIGARGGDMGGPPGVASAPEPEMGVSLFEAVDRQLGLKLEQQKRSLPVIVIDHIELKPTEN